MNQPTVGRGGPWGRATPVGFNAAPVYVYQQPDYTLASAAYNPEVVNADAYYYSLTLRVTGTFNGSVILANALAADTGIAIALGGNGVNIPPDSDMPLTGEVGRWTAGTQFVRLLISDSGQDGFNLCWHSEVGAVKRLTCNVFGRADGAWRAAYVNDDYEGVIREYR